MDFEFLYTESMPGRREGFQKNPNQLESSIEFRFDRHFFKCAGSHFFMKISD